MFKRRIVGSTRTVAHQLHRQTEVGVAQLDGPLNGRIAGLWSGHEITIAGLDRLKARSRDLFRVTPELVAQFSASMREH